MMSKLADDEREYIWACGVVGEEVQYTFNPYAGYDGAHVVDFYGEHAQRVIAEARRKAHDRSGTATPRV